MKFESPAAALVVSSGFILLAFFGLGLAFYILVHSIAYLLPLLTALFGWFMEFPLLEQIVLIGLFGVVLVVAGFLFETELRRWRRAP